MAQAVQNKIRFRYILMDIWYGSAENIKFIRYELDKHCITPLKGNRKMTLGLEDKKQRKYQRVETLLLKDHQTREI